MWAIKSLYHRVAEAGIKAILRKIEFVNIPCAEFNVPDPMHPRVFFGPSEFLITQIDTDYAAYLFSNAQRDTAATTTDIQNSKLWCQVRIQKLSVVVGASAGHVIVKVCTHALDTWVAMAGNVMPVCERRACRGVAEGQGAKGAAAQHRAVMGRGTQWPSLKVQEVVGETSLTCKISPARGGRIDESSRVRTAIVVP